jgi:exonuclease III
LTEWLKNKQNPSFCCIQETHLINKHRHYLRVKGWNKDFQANRPKKPAGIIILTPNKIDFQTKLIKRAKLAHFILTKGKKNLPDNISILNVYAPNEMLHTCVKETLLKLKTDIGPQH